MTKNNWLKLIASIAVCEAAGIAGSFFTAGSISSGWYNSLPKPALTPPSWVFAPAWTTLYLLMGVSLFLVLKHPNILGNVGMSGKRKLAISLFFFQLALNVLWSILFFGLHNPALAFADIIVLWLSILATIIAFAKTSVPSSKQQSAKQSHDKLAAWLLVPYLLWVSFASYLNGSIWFSVLKTTDGGNIVCAQDVKICGDGSYVTRTSPNCEFGNCPDNHSAL
ncbi:hypothetical protein A3I34_00895 [Candidatus Jorgensenbacteria bacterium RIFCSPLOWO2_02_FULL_45_12]|uniref:Benzodiazepine receptor TspO n=1 Tax=Candidatus Jorgensenbacteria bacterium GW2011_GWA2_45_9 TaxID=1618663 RepID=A0A0G1R1E1_9BACT|nr:MAG: Benzodiazepine receptor TspO [Candidatus Jorgensenbacteria bacterium GW2011_GWA2_45_9]OGG42569.1 MAG: hypothetical protein A3I34_00895 [Candidatus Jorgensenbacteria bacterium RIFCSPLOWO2_02_FULL_45_12]